MRKRIKHIHAEPAEWIKVHRKKSRSPSGSLGWVGIAALIAGLWIAWELLKWLVELFLDILPYLLVAGAIAAGVYIWSKVKRKP